MAFSSADRSRAARIRKILNAGGRVSRADQRFYDRYEAIKEANKRKRLSASKKARGRAARLTAKRKRGETLTKAEDTELRRYKRDRRLNREFPLAASLPTTAIQDAREILRALTRWLAPELLNEAPIDTEWQRKPGDQPGIATATITTVMHPDDDQYEIVAPNTEAEGIDLNLPPQNGRKFSLRVEIAGDDRPPRWTALTARDGEWWEAAQEARRSLNDVMTAYQVRGITGLSIIIS